MTMAEFGLYNWRGGGSMWFAPVSQARGSETLKQVELATRILNAHGLDCVGEFIVTQRAMHHSQARPRPERHLRAGQVRDRHRLIPWRMRRAIR
jgi:hypothetical protein